VPHRQMHRRVVDFIVRQLGLPEAEHVVSTAVDRLALMPKRLRDLEDYLIAHPDALVSGRSDGPVSRLRLLDVLVESFPEQVVRARCAQCGRQTLVNRRGPGEGRICVSCYAANRIAACGRCGRTRTVGGRHSEFGLVCPGCIGTDPTRWRECASCGRAAPVAARHDTGDPLCQNCRPRERFTCGGCGRTQTVRSLNINGGSLCRACYKRHHQQGCSQCGQLHSQVPARGPKGERICDRCWTPDPIPCRICGEISPIKKRSADGTGACNPCRRRARRGQPCAGCGSIAAVQAVLPLGPVCSACYQEVRYKPQPCPACGGTRPLVGLNRAGQRICAVCCGQKNPWRCRTCGDLAAPYSVGRCLRCTAQDDLDALLSDSRGAPIPLLASLRDYFDTDGHPLALINWIRRARSPKVLKALTETDSPITHEMLDSVTPGTAVGFLRDLLVFTGVLEPRAFELDDTPAWLSNRLASTPPANAVVLRRYTIWHVLKRARRRPIRPATRHHVRGRVSEAARLLEWLDTKGVELGELTQAHVNSWLAQGPQTRFESRDFVRWARSQGLVRNVRVPARRRSRPSIFLAPEDRWSALNRCVVDDSLALKVRTAAALLLLFGLGPTTLATLKIEQIIGNRGRTEVQIGATPIPLPDSVAALVDAQRKEAGQCGSGIWLFPGANPGRHASPDALSMRVKACLRVGARPARNAALAQLARDLPVPVLADYLGIAPTTAAQWAELVQRTWTEYVALRRTERNRVLDE